MYFLTTYCILGTRLGTGEAKTGQKVPVLMGVKLWRRQTLPSKTAAAAAAAAAKSLQSCPTLCDPIDGSPPGSLLPGILQARTLEWVAISFSNA